MTTGGSSPIAKAPGAKLSVDSVVLGTPRKGETVVGADLLDIPAMQHAGLAADTCVREHGGR